MFTSFLERDYRTLIEEKLKESIASGTSQEYKEILAVRGQDLTYTLITRGIDTPSDNVEDIIDMAIKVLSKEIDGIASNIITGSDGKSIKGFTRGKKINVTKAPQALRSKSGRFIGALKLATLLNSMVKIKAKEIMKGSKYGTTLNFRTGRLANSVNITSFNAKRSSIYFSYMYSPYKVFEPGASKYKKGRDPRDIFANAIAESMSLLLSQKDLEASRFSVYSGRSKHGDIINGDFR